MSSWPIEIDGNEYQPVPESWIEHGRDEDGVGPQCLAVSAYAWRGRLHIRYAHPAGTKVGAMHYPAVERDDGGGLVPEALVQGDFARSIAAGNLEPVGDIRLEERQHLGELWRDRVEDVFDHPPDIDLDVFSPVSAPSHAILTVLREW